MRSAIGTVLIALLWLAPARAQDVARFSIDSTLAIDTVRGDNAVHRPNIIGDITGVVRFGREWVVYVRPWFRQPRNDTWNKEIYQAALQYQHHRGHVATRVDAGYIVSPIGLGMADTRPGTNPTIMPHLAYVTSMPVFDRGAPRVTPIAPSYPLGAQLTLSTDRWDSRVAIVDTAPTRAFVIGRANNPPRTAIVEAGAGISPVTGLRLGVSFAHGAYVASSEIVPHASSDRNLTLVGVEGEFGVGHTRVSGEVIRDTLDSGVGPQAAYEWFLQGTHAISPRWFVSARTEGSSAPGQAPVRPRTVLRVNEATVGFRLTPELTVKGSGLARKGFTATDADLQVAAQLVWAHRWY